MPDIRHDLGVVLDMLCEIAEGADMRSLRENQCVLCTWHPYGTHYPGCPLAAYVNDAQELDFADSDT